jgi:hypothetical protein
LAIIDDKAETSVSFFDKETRGAMRAIGGGDDTFIYPFCNEEVECLGFNLGHVIGTLAARNRAGDEINTEGTTIPRLSVIAAVENVRKFIEHSCEGRLEVGGNILG